MNKKIKSYIALLLSGAAFFTSCGNNDGMDHSNSVVISSMTEENDFDKWLYSNFLEPYNIKIRYRFEDIQSDYKYHLAPSKMDKSIQLAHLLKFMCIEPYDQITGSKQFIRSLFPKELDIIGSSGINPNGTELLGVAEGGRKIVLYKTNYMNVEDYPSLNEQYFHTIHHEFTHIQNQTKPYPDEFKIISKSEYVGNAWSEASTYGNPSNIKDQITNSLLTETVKRVNEILPRVNELGGKLQKGETLTDAEKTEYQNLSNEIDGILKDPQKSKEIETFDHVQKALATLTTSEVNAIRAGFISPYGSSNDVEDFAELQAFYITDAPEIWNAKLVIAGDKGRAIITQKMNIVKNYLKTAWSVDIDALRDEVQKRSKDVSSLDINSLVVNK